MIRGKINICVVDNIGGSYLPAAITLSKYFGRTYYYSVVQSPYPRLSTESIGYGYDEIEVLNEFWSRLDDFDIVIFTDIYFSDWGKHLREMGKLVFGGTDAEELENDRKLFKTELKKVNLPVAETKYIKGAKNLKNYLSSVEDKWVKLSYYRGEVETFHHKNIKFSQTKLDQIILNSGPLESELEFIVEDPIESVCETGFDGWTINGQFTETSMFGFEVKNKAYIGKKINYDELPDPVKIVNERFSPVLQKWNHTGFFSTEIRCTENGVYYFTDPCMRMGSPPSNTYLNMIGNWDEIIFAAVNGDVVEPKFIGDYGVEIILKSEWVNNNFLPVSFPKEYKDNIKLKASFIKDGDYYLIPQKHAGYDLPEIGSVVVVDNNLDAAMEKALEIASQVEGYDISYDENAFSKAADVMQNAKEKLGVNF